MKTSNLKPSRYTLIGALRLASPLHIASPGASRLSLTHCVPTTEKHGSVPLVRVQTLPFVTAEGFSSTPVIAANNLIGRLRRHAARHVLNVIAGKGEKVNIQTYSALLCGAVTGNPDGRDASFDEYKETRAHPYIGLFGGGPRMMRRYVRAYNAVTYSAKTEAAGLFSVLRHPALEDMAQENRITGFWSFVRRDDLRDLADMETGMRSVEDFDRTHRERQAAIIEANAGRDDESSTSSDSADRLSTKAISAIEFVLPGTTFQVAFELDVNSAQMGLFLHSLDSFAKDERLGGYVRNGFGAFVLSDVVLLDEQGAEHSGLFEYGRLVRDHEAVAPHLKAWEDACGDLNAADLDRLLKAPEPEETRKGKKRAAKKAAEESTAETAGDA